MKKNELFLNFIKLNRVKNMFKLILLVFSLVVKSVFGDQIIVTSPTVGQIIKNFQVEVEYEIVRRDMLYITNSTVELLDGVKIDQVFINVHGDTIVKNKFYIKSKIQNPIVRITGYGRYLANGNETMYMTKEVLVPIQIDYSLPDNIRTPSDILKYLPDDNVYENSAKKIIPHSAFLSLFFLFMF